MAQTGPQSDGTAPSAPSMSFNDLMNAISGSAADTVRRLLDQEPQLAYSFGWHRQTALHRACLAGSIAVVQILLDRNADPNARNNFDETPLHYACKRGVPPVVLLLVERGADIMLVDKLGKGVLHHAAEAGSVPVLHLLCARFPELQLTCQDGLLQTPLHVAIKAAHLDAFKYLIRKGRSDLKQADSEGNWPLHIAAQEGYGHMTWSLLCLQGLQALYVQNKHGCSPYELAVMYDTPGHKELIKELEWLRRIPDGSDVKQKGILLWFFFLLLPMLLYTSALLLTRVVLTYDGLFFLAAIVPIICLLKKSFHRVDHLSRWPNPIYAGVFAAGLAHTILVHYVVIMPYLFESVYFVLLSVFLTLVVVSMYIRLVTVDPGIVNNSVQDASGRYLTIVDICKPPGKWETFCVSCEIVQPDLTKHCKLCDHCMAGMDHHCLFLLNCIAHGNHTLFVWFILICMLCMGLFVFGVYIYCAQVYGGHGWGHVLHELVTVDGWVCSLLILNCASFLWAVSLLLYQYAVISNGYKSYFVPEHHGDVLSGYEKLRNVLNFLLNRKPHIINPCLKV